MRAGFLLRISFLYVWRSWRSTMVLAVMVSTAVAALVFLSSLAVGTNDAMIRNSVGLFSGHVAGDNLPSGLRRSDLSVEGVERVLLRRRQSAWIGSGDRFEPLVLVGMQPSEEKSATALWRKTVQGRYPEDGEAAVFLGEPVAEKLRVAVGDLVRVGREPGSTDAELRVSGVYRTGLVALDQAMAFCPEAVLPGQDGALSAALYLREGVDPEKVVETLRVSAGASDFRTWSELMPDLKQLIDLNFFSMEIVMALVLGIVSLGISCAFIIFILKNLREHGIMKAMGILPGEAALLILSQVTLLTLWSSLIGAGCGAAAVAALAPTGIDLTAFTSHNQYFVVSGIITPRLTPYSLGVPPVIAVLFGLLAAIWPSVFVIRENAAEILRSL